MADTNTGETFPASPPSNYSVNDLLKLHFSFIIH